MGKTKEEMHGYGERELADSWCEKMQRTGKRRGGLSAAVTP